METDSQVLFDSLLEAGEEDVVALHEVSNMEGLGERRDSPQNSEEYVWEHHGEDSHIPHGGDICVEGPKQALALESRQAERSEAISFLNPFYAASRPYDPKDQNYRIPQLTTCDHEAELQEAADQVYDEWNHFGNGVPTNQFLVLPSHHLAAMDTASGGINDVEYQIRRRYSMAVPGAAPYDLSLMTGNRAGGSSLQFVIEDPSGKENFRDVNPAENQGRRHSMGAPHLYCCPWTGCNKVFNRFYNLRSHYRIHSGEKPFTCNYCEASFARNHDLKRHERIHLKTKPYACPICTKAFSRNDAMNRHVRLNSCSKPSI